MNIEDAAVATDGKQWEKDLPDLGDFEVLVAPWDNAEFERALNKSIRKLPAGLRPDGMVDPVVYYGCVGRAMAKAILFDWKNFTVGGVEKPFDKAYAETLLTDQKYRPIRDGVVAAAKRVQLGIKKEEEDLQGNSSASSPGNGAGEASKTV
jgi:hypothetical protein